MLLAMDIGNTRIKAAVFKDDVLFETMIFTKPDMQENLEIILKNYSKITDLALCSVENVNMQEFLLWNQGINLHYISQDTSFPFKNLYETPLTLGVDRMVLAAGAVLRYPNQNRLVIDAGTCVTYDFIDSGNHYLGGAISPGIRLRYEALHQYTANLPLLRIESISMEEHQSRKPALTGSSTHESIHSGVINGIVNEIDGFINQYELLYPNFIIILTGGDADFLAKRLKNTIFANSNFLLESLNQTYQYKIKND